jgi:hypothetical protein
MKSRWEEVLPEELYLIDFSMRKRLTGFQIFVTSTLIFCLIIISILFFKRQLPYNSEDRYFDPESLVVYHEQSIDVLLLALIVIGFFLVACIVWCVRSLKA